MRQVPIADHHHAVPDVKWRPPIVLPDVVRVHDHGSVVPVGVGVRVTERVKTAERKLGIQAQIEIGNQLVLVEEAAGLVIVDVPGGVAIGARSELRFSQWEGSGQRRIDIVGEKLVDSVGIKIGQ